MKNLHQIKVNREDQFTHDQIKILKWLTGVLKLTTRYNNNSWEYLDRYSNTWKNFGNNEIGRIIGDHQVKDISIKWNLLVN